MHKVAVTLLIVIGLALLLAAASAWAFPGWLDDAPGGLLALLGAALLAVAGLGGKLRDWREFLFPEEEKPSNSQGVAPHRSQKMFRSPRGEQTMRGGSGTQMQEMSDSPQGKQRME